MLSSSSVCVEPVMRCWVILSFQCTVPVLGPILLAIPIHFPAAIPVPVPMLIVIPIAVTIGFPIEHPETCNFGWIFLLRIRLAR